MIIKQFYDKELSHASYAIVSDSQMAIIDPSRDPEPYYTFANENKANIVYVLETHPHADFVSSHLQIHNEKRAEILVNSLVGASYPHKSYDDGDTISMGSVTIQAIFTPGHSPDSNSYLVTDTKTNEKALFSGDFLFIGDVGRPDLRESAGATTNTREKLAGQMFESIHEKISDLPDGVIIYPTHGAGSLCGKNLSDQLSDSLGNQRKTNWAFQKQSKTEFIGKILEDQPFVPKYFPWSVEENRKGAQNMSQVFSNISFIKQFEIPKGSLVVDVRDSENYKQETLSGAINIPAGDRDKFETWLGSIISPEEQFYIIVSSKEEAYKIVNRVAKIGYEKNIIGICFNLDSGERSVIQVPQVSHIKQHETEYTIIDVRQASEHIQKPIFGSSLNIPLAILRENIAKIPKDKPILVHCAGGYRSAIASSIISTLKLGLEVIDLGVEVINI